MSFLIFKCPHCNINSHGELGLALCSGIVSTFWYRFEARSVQQGLFRPRVVEQQYPESCSRILFFILWLLGSEWAKEGRTLEEIQSLFQ
jgi:hypothetical protein